MPACDMCGCQTEYPVKTKIESTILDVCKGCARFGEVVRRPAPIRTKNIPQGRSTHNFTPRRPELLQLIVPDYANQVKRARAKMGLTQEEFAKKLNEKCSIMQKLESGQFKPSINMARKLEKLLKVSLVEDHDEKGEVPVASPKQSKGAGFTLGDFIKKR